MELYTSGLPLVLQFDVILWLVIGCVVGMLIGAMPGLTVTMGVAVLAPLTFNMDTVAAFALLLGAYTSATYGGSISAILLRIPGALPAVMTILDGYPMAQRGEGGRAIAIATIASLFGGIVSAIVLATLAPALARLALQFSAADYLAVSIFALSMIVFISGGNMAKGALSGAIGLLIATVGLDPIVGFPRFSAGIPELQGGVGLVPVMIGLFGLSEVLSSVHSTATKPDGRIVHRIKSAVPSMVEFVKLLPAMVRASVIGVLIGILPAAGSSTASMVAYGVGKRTSRKGSAYGTGEPEGLATSESANNASTGGDMVPTLSLGIPGSSSAAILMGALILHGLQPGPLLFTQHPDIVSAIFILFLASNFVFFLLGLTGAGLFARLLEIPKNYLLPVVAMLCLVGAYSLQNSLFDVGIMLLAGIVGVFFRWAKVPASPLILGLILGPMIEANLQRTFILSYGSGYDIFLRPISLSFLIATVLFLFGPWALGKLKARSQ